MPPAAASKKRGRAGTPRKGAAAPLNPALAKIDENEASSLINEEADRAKTQKSRAAARCTGCQVQKPKRGTLYQ